ncbi:hypothetical protein Tdes44962_MAKER04655 [Teratosphaeria destructans]|uniref:Uncharacterized protein n=1 Tax=Teratosphaeria destructans TaxID=418781 RepID=A0A9W7SLX6_9PEZI|nr:hypothetical protein Tdes44962_MAKER04655 [Teratosphaeria destructans]
MLPAAVLLICGIGLSAVEASSTKRQATAAALQSIISNVAAAEFAAQAATGGRNTSSYYCGLSGQEDNLNKQGMNGTLGQLLT